MAAAYIPYGTVALLCAVANGFKKVIPGNLFFGRYGGDEFVLMGQLESEDELRRMMERSDAMIQELCRKEGFPFRLGFSYGMARKTAETESIPALLNRADTAMYNCKKANKAGRTK